MEDMRPNGGMSTKAMLIFTFVVFTVGTTIILTAISLAANGGYAY